MKLSEQTQADIDRAFKALDALEQIRDEIEQCKGKWNDTSSDTCFDIVLQIIDKYREEQTE